MWCHKFFIANFSILTPFSFPVFAKASYLKFVKMYHRSIFRFCWILIFGKFLSFGHLCGATHDGSRISRTTSRQLSRQSRTSATFSTMGHETARVCTHPPPPSLSLPKIFPMSSCCCSSTVSGNTIFIPAFSRSFHRSQISRWSEGRHTCMFKRVRTRMLENLGGAN